LCRPNGDIFIGDFKEGKPHGIGIYIDMQEMTKRHGEWKEGKRMCWLSGPQEIETNGSPVKALAHMTRLHMTA